MNNDFIDLSGDGGLLKKIIQEGDLNIGKPPNGYEIKAHYHGTLEDGTEFDSSVRRNSPFTFQLGQDKVIRGWDLGVAGMKVGETRKLTIPYELAYGADGFPPTIPQKATLIFEVTLLGISSTPAGQ